MNLIQKYEQYKFRKILEKDNPTPAEIFNHYIKMPNSFYYYLKNKDVILNLFMMEHRLKEIITVDELLDYINYILTNNKSLIFDTQTTSLIYFLNNYINEIKEDHLFSYTLRITGNALFGLNYPETGSVLIARQLELFKLMTQIQPQNNIFCETRLSPHISQFNHVNLMDMLGLIMRHHNDFKACPFEIFNTDHFETKEGFEIFKQRHDMYTIYHEQLKELLDKGWRFSIPELYHYFYCIMPPELMQDVLLAQSLSGENNKQFISVLEINEKNKNKAISFSQIAFE